MIPGGVGGTEIYLRTLLAALAEIDPLDEYFIFANRETGRELAPPAPNFHYEPQPVPGVSRPARTIWEQCALPVVAARRGLDVLLNAGLTAPLLCPCASVTVMHDLQHLRLPQNFRWYLRPFWRMFLFQSAVSSDALIAVSEATRDDLLRYYPVPASRIHVIGHGVDEKFFELGHRRRERPPQPMVLCVSTLHPHKNLERLVRAFAAFRRTRPEYRLVLAGMRGHHAEAIEKAIAQAGQTETVRVTGWIERERLYELFLDAAVFVYPSTFEGFGMPILEAMAAGVPTACSNIEPMRGIAGPAALMFPPEDEAAITEALLRLTSEEELRDRLSRDGPERASRFSWRRAAEATLEVLRSVA